MIDPSTTEIKWFLLTVPHSGTRYIRSCFEKCLGGFHSYSSAVAPKPGTKMLWGHTCLKHLDKARMWSEYLEDRTFIMLRDPFLVLSTWINNGATVESAVNAVAAMALLDREFQYKYFPVERTQISEISQWSGVALPDTKKHFSSGFNDLKDAARAHDITPFKELEHFDLYLRTVNTANHIYENAGYEIWWDK